MFAMLRTLLADRFQLILHRETKDMAIYALVLARADGKLGPQLKPATTDCAAMMAAARGRGAAPPPPPAPGERMPCGMRMFPGNLSGRSSPTAPLTTVPARFVNRTGVYQTGLTGNFDLDLQWTPDKMPQARGDPPPGAPALPPSIRTAPRSSPLSRSNWAEARINEGPRQRRRIDRVEHPAED